MPEPSEMIRQKLAALQQQLQGQTAGAVALRRPSRDLQEQAAIAQQVTRVLEKDPQLRSMRPLDRGRLALSLAEELLAFRRYGGTVSPLAAKMITQLWPVSGTPPVTATGAVSEGLRRKRLEALAKRPRRVIVLPASPPAS